MKAEIRLKIVRLKGPIPAYRETLALLDRRKNPDSRLTPMAFGIHTFLRVFEVDWNFNQVDLAGRLGITRKTVRKYLSQLKGSGLLEIERIKKGLPGEWLWTVYPVPLSILRKGLKDGIYEFE